LEHQKVPSVVEMGFCRKRGLDFTDNVTLASIFIEGITNERIHVIVCPHAPFHHI
jgi:hypothetical protein